MPITYEGYTLEISQDEHAQSPLEEFEMTTRIFVPRRNRYFAGHKDARDPTEMGQDEVALYVPIYGLVHGSQTVSTSSFNDPWDSGQIGWAYLPAGHPNIAGFGEAEMHEFIDGEIGTWRQWMEGEVFSVVVKDPNGDVISSIGGIYGEPDDQTLLTYDELPEGIMAGLVQARAEANNPPRRAAMQR